MVMFLSNSFLNLTVWTPEMAFTTCDGGDDGDGKEIDVKMGIWGRMGGSRGVGVSGSFVCEWMWGCESRGGGDEK